jgi:hypothetical protein
MQQSVDPVVTLSLLRQTLAEFKSQISTDISEVIVDLTHHIDERFQRIEYRLDAHDHKFELMLASTSNNKSTA